MQAMFYVPEEEFSTWVAPFQAGGNRREAIKAMVKAQAAVAFSPLVRAVATEVAPSRARTRGLEPAYNADYNLRGQILAGAEGPSKGLGGGATWHFILDCGFNTRLEVRDITIEDPFEPSTHYTSTSKFQVGDFVELEGTLEARAAADHPPFTATLQGRTLDVVPIARGIGVFMTVEITKAEPYREVPWSRPKGKRSSMEGEKRGGPGRMKR